MKNKAVALEDVIAKELKNEEFRVAFEEHTLYLQMARLISDLRKRTGLTQKELAARAKVSQPMIARLEKGDSLRTPTFETIFKLLKAMGYTLSIQIRKRRAPSAA